MTKSKGLQFRKTEADTLVVEAQKHPGEQFKVTKLSKTSAVYLLKKLRGRGCSPELTFTKVWYLDDGPKTEKNRRYHVFYGMAEVEDLSGTDPWEWVGHDHTTGERYECTHCGADLHPDADADDPAEHESQCAWADANQAPTPPPELSPTEPEALSPEPPEPEPEPDVVIGQTVHKARDHCIRQGWLTAVSLEAGPAAEAEVARMIKPRVVRL